MRTKKSREVERSLHDVNLDALVHAPWNPRSKEELDEKNPEMQKLIASVKARGVLQPIVVWMDPPGSEEPFVIAGNRRFVAAKVCGLKTVPAACFEGLDEATAREITRIENELRLGISPLKDADLIQEMTNKYKYSVAEIAAHFGVSEATVRRRARLSLLVPEIRELAEKGGITADALEHMALYPTETQKKCVNALRMERKRRNSEHNLSWSDVSFAFVQFANDLDGAKFDKWECTRCVERTGAQADLWGDVGEKSLGKCLCVQCYERKHRHWQSDQARVAATPTANGQDPDKIGLIDAERIITHWQAERMIKTNGFFALQRDKNHPLAWWWNYTDRPLILWGKGDAAKLKKVQEEEQAEREKEGAEDRKERAEYEKKQRKLSALRDAADKAFEECGLEKALESLDPSDYDTDTPPCDYTALGEEYAKLDSFSDITEDEMAALISLALAGLWSLYCDASPEEAAAPLQRCRPLADALGIGDMSDYFAKLLVFTAEKNESFGSDNEDEDDEDDEEDNNEDEE